MEEIIFCLKHYWRFVDSEALELKALSQGVDEQAAWTQAKLRDRNSQGFEFLADIGTAIWSSRINGARNANIL